MSHINMIILGDSLVYSGLSVASAIVQPDVHDPPAEVLVPRHHVHSVAQLCHTQDTKGMTVSYRSSQTSSRILF